MPSLLKSIIGLVAAATLKAIYPDPAPEGVPTPASTAPPSPQDLPHLTEEDLDRALEEARALGFVDDEEAASLDEAAAPTVPAHMLDVDTAFQIILWNHFSRPWRIHTRRPIREVC